MTRVATLVLVVRNLERAVSIYAGGLGFQPLDEPSDVPSLGARHVVLRAANTLVELLEPYDAEKPPGLFLRARGEGLFSLALEVDHPAQAKEQLASSFVDVRGGDDPQRWFVRPADAQGILLQVGPTDAS